MDVITTIILLGIIQGILLSIALLTIKRGYRTANRFLSLLIFSLALSLYTHILSNTKFYLVCPHLLLITHPLLFLYGPFFYFYAKSLTATNLKLKSNTILHFVPFVLLVIYYAVTFYFRSGDYKIAFKEAHLAQRGIIWGLITPMQMLQLFIYLFMINRLLINHKRAIKESFSSLERINLIWIRLIVILFAYGAGTLSIILFIRMLGYETFAMTYGRYIYACIVTINIYIMGYMGIRQPEIFTGTRSSDRRKKYESSPLTREKSKEYIEKLLQIMDEKKPYTDPALTLHKLADLLFLPSYQLSQLINERLNQNFFDFINSHRIEEAKHRLQDPESRQKSIVAIAYDVGFHSKSTFNSAFKKYTKMTPSQYRNTSG